MIVMGKYFIFATMMLIFAHNVMNGYQQLVATRNVRIVPTDPKRQKTL
jgi:hypothetical protein